MFLGIYGYIQEERERERSEIEGMEWQVVQRYITRLYVMSRVVFTPTICSGPTNVIILVWGAKEATALLYAGFTDRSKSADVVMSAIRLADYLRAHTLTLSHTCTGFV